MLVLLLGGGGAAAWFMFGGKRAEKVEAKPLPPPIYVNMDPPFVVNFESQSVVRFLQVAVGVMTRDPAVETLIENNDPRGRLMAAINYNGDIAEYWEFADQGFMPIAISNEAFKLGVNYVVYALTR